MPAGDLWTLYEEAGVQYFNEIVCYSDDPAEATMTWFVLRLLGFPRVLVYLREGAGL
jgi:3-mercaptopyruvate sulfurtransferase SseA